MSAEYFGLVNVILSAAMIIYPILSFGMGPAIIRYFSINSKRNERGEFISFALFFPILIIIALGFIYYLFIPKIDVLVSEKSVLIKDYLFYIFVFGVFMAYFEVFYAYSKVQLKSVFGNVLKEIFIRVVVTILLVLLYFNKITEHEFVVYLMIFYGIRVLIMAWYSLKDSYKELVWKLPSNASSIIKYVVFVVLSASISFLFLEIDKVMVSQLIDLSNVAYYAVATFIGIVVAVPGRAMQQILNPLVASALADNDMPKVYELYKKSSINLIAVSGLIFLLITVNTASLFSMFDDKFQGGETVVLYIALAKLIMMSMGSNNSIMANSRYYRYDLLFGILTIGVTIFLNILLIPKLGIDGAALATAITIALYSFIRYVFVYIKFGMQPYTLQTLYLIAFVVILYFLGVDLVLSTNPILNILFKSIVVGVLYGLYLVLVKPSNDIVVIIEDLKNKFLKK
jgi:O-antigen/teichoic acid export membrane protein